MDGASALKIEHFARWDDLPPAYDGLEPEGAALPLLAGQDWLELLSTTGLQAGLRTHLIGARRAETGLALLPLLINKQGRRFHRLDGLTTYYSLDFAPLGAKDDHLALALDRIAAEIGRTGLASTVCFNPLPVDGDAFNLLNHAFENAGFRTSTFRQSGRWFVRTADQNYDAYLSGRPSNLRNTLQRRMSQAEKAGEVSFEIAALPDDVARLLPAYEAVYQKSWKTSEPSPGFIPALCRWAAQTKALRLGVLSFANQPVVAQIWLISGPTDEPRASIYKLAHDPAAEL
ncbi:MAG: GNAT family N-acetyltransferase, partial [Alphaproteobacteria bacterium]|nr:GNAT family N-acetyltransferase [Alphaproteobacteria bacterium]